MYEQVRAQVHGSYVAHGAVDNANASTGTTGEKKVLECNPMDVTGNASSLPPWG